MKSLRLFLPTAVSLALLGGCADLGLPAQRSALYDLGLAEPAAPVLAARPAGIEVRAPSWLASAAMQYRLDYRQPSQRELYLESRWASPPAEMIGHALERGIVSGGAVFDCRLRLDVDEFVQVFPDPRTSYAELVVRAQLLPIRGAPPVARETFVIRETAPTPDAQGGVVAHRQAVQALTNRLASWLAGLDQTGAQGLNSGQRCKQ